MRQEIDNLVREGIEGKCPERGLLEEVVSRVDLTEEFIQGAGAIARHFFGRRVKLCSIVNAKSGACMEDCRFCAQSVRHKAAIERYGLLGKKEREAAFRELAKGPVSCVSFVSSGRGLREGEFREILDSVSRLRGELEVDVDLSLGTLDAGQAEKLKEAGVRRYHHNLETSENYFPSVCTTHSYRERVQTVRHVKQAGLEVCSGGIFGIGEDWKDRLDLAFLLRELGVHSVPLNFLVPVPGTPLESRPLLDPVEALLIIAAFRYVLPDRDIRVCGGREHVLGDWQKKIFDAGANGMMVGGYLTIGGRPVEEDLEMLKRLGLEPERDFSDWSNGVME